MSNIDFLIIGSGLYGATIARILNDAGYVCLILEKRNHIAGNIYTENIYGYDKHVYGPHIFHTNKSHVEKFVKKYADWRSYRQNTLATDGEHLYHLPFNMNTYYDIFGVMMPAIAYEIIEEEKRQYSIENPKNLEEQAINMVGKTIYEKLIKTYTEKQWGKKCTEINPDVIKRLPLRLSYNNNYFNDNFQAIPRCGYTKFVENIIGDIPYLCNIEFNKDTYEYWKDNINYNIIYCGAVDELLDYQLGKLEWRSLNFEDKEFIYNEHNGQGTSIVNDVSDKPYTRCIEHMWFRPSKVKNGIISIQTFEFPENWEPGKERYYPINNAKTDKQYKEYIELLNKEMPKMILGGRLGKYKYFDMDDTIAEAIKDARELIEKYSANIHEIH